MLSRTWPLRNCFQATGLAPAIDTLDINVEGGREFADGDGSTCHFFLPYVLACTMWCKRGFSSFLRCPAATFSAFVQRGFSFLVVGSRSMSFPASAAWKFEGVHAAHLAALELVAIVVCFGPVLNLTVDTTPGARREIRTRVVTNLAGDCI